MERGRVAGAHSHSESAYPARSSHAHRLVRHPETRKLRPAISDAQPGRRDRTVGPARRGRSEATPAARPDPSFKGLEGTTTSRQETPRRGQAAEKARLRLVAAGLSVRGREREAGLPRAPTTTGAGPWPRPWPPSDLSSRLRSRAPVRALPRSLRWGWRDRR